jgi:hypothetical protein
MSETDRAIEFLQNRKMPRPVCFDEQSWNVALGEIGCIKYLRVKWEKGRS